MANQARRLDRDDESRLLRFIDRVNDLVEEGELPTDAVVKVASTVKLPPGHVRLACQGFNIGRANFLRKTAESLLERAQPVPLADAEEALRRLYPDHVVSAAALVRSHGLSGDYTSGENELKKAARAMKRSARQEMEKTASCDAPPGPVRRVHRELERKAASAVRQWRRLLAQLDANVVHAEDGVKSACEEAVLCVRRGEVANLDQAEKDFVALRGGPAAELFSYLKEKCASFRYVKEARQFTGPCVIDQGKRPWSVFLVACDAIELAKQAVAEKEAAQKEESPRLLQEALFPFLEQEKQAAAAQKDSLPGAKGGPADFLNRAGEGVISMMRPFGSTALDTFGALTAPLRDHDQSSANWKGKDDKALAHLTSVSHEGAMEHARLKAVLSDLSANDPVISGYHPDDVSEAFNELQQLAPRATRQPALLKALLRRHLAQGSLDTHELKQLLDAEKQLRDVRTVPGADKSLPEDLRPVGPIGGGRGYGREGGSPKSPLASIISRIGERATT